jgi:predicted GNAT family N-acyltransferase
VLRKAAPEQFRVEALSPDHLRTQFSCGVPELDRYLEHRAGQDLKRKMAAFLVLTEDGRRVSGFYTLSAHSIFAAELPPESQKSLPRYPIPVTLLGRMALDESLHGKGLGEFLLLNALERSWLASREVASWAMVLDSKAGAREFYIRYGFIPLPSRSERLFLPMKTIEKLFIG